MGTYFLERDASGADYYIKLHRKTSNEAPKTLVGGGKNSKFLLVLERAKLKGTLNFKERLVCVAARAECLF